MATTSRLVCANPMCLRLASLKADLLRIAIITQALQDGYNFDVAFADMLSQATLPFLNEAGTFDVRAASFPPLIMRLSR